MHIAKEPLNKSNVHTGAELFPSSYTNSPCLTPVRRRQIYAIWRKNLSLHCTPRFNQRFPNFVLRLQGNSNQTARRGLSAKIKFAKANIIFSLAVCFCRPRYRVFRYRSWPLTTAKTCSTFARTDDFSCSLRLSCPWERVDFLAICEGRRLIL